MPKSIVMSMNKAKDGTMDLSYPLLNRGNYMEWALKIEVYMQAHGVWVALK